MSRVALDQSLIDSVHTADEVIDILRTRMVGRVRPKKGFLTIGFILRLQKPFRPENALPW